MEVPLPLCPRLATLCHPSTHPLTYITYPPLPPPKHTPSRAQAPGANEGDPEATAGAKRKWYEEQQKKKEEELARLGLEAKEAHRLETAEVAQAKYEKAAKKPAAFGWDAFNQVGGWWVVVGCVGVGWGGGRAGKGGREGEGREESAVFGWDALNQVGGGGVKG
jgi:hypothetical protein